MLSSTFLPSTDIEYSLVYLSYLFYISNLNKNGDTTSYYITQYNKQDMLDRVQQTLVRAR
jgi:hypothetical protein